MLLPKMLQRRGKMKRCYEMKGITPEYRHPKYRHPKYRHPKYRRPKYRMTQNIDTQNDELPKISKFFNFIIMYSNDRK